MNAAQQIAETSADFIRSIFFFLDPHQQSCMVSFLHYFVFAVGFYLFFFSKNDFHRIIFFFFVLGAALSYDLFNRCIFTSIECALSPHQNPIQRFMCDYFGEEIEGNESTKYFLRGSSIVLGIIILIKHFKSKAAI